MYLKKLVMEGFKSFGERLTVELHKGLTVIVGPNGAGKSNILDAIKWVFGTRSLKDIRIDEVKNILFHGVNKKAHYAYVEAILGYENNPAAEDIAIARKLYEDGTYEYYLNGQLVRLKDIKEFITKNASAFTDYSLFEQNNVDSILKISARERAEFFEEIAGLSFYRLKYDETLKTLEKVKEKLTPLEKKINEIKKEKMALQKEAEETKEYLKTIDELKITKKQLINTNLYKMYNEANSYKNSLEILEKELLNLYELLITGECKSKSLKEKVYDIRAGLDYLDKEITSILQIKGKKFEELKIAQQEFQHFKEEFNKIVASEDILKNQMQTLEKKVSYLDDQKIQSETNLMSLTQYLNSLSEMKENLLENKNTIEQEVKNCDEKLLEFNWELTNVNNQISKIEQELKEEGDNLNITLEKIQSKSTIKDEYDKKIAELDRIIKELNSTLQQEKEMFKTMESRLRAIEDSSIKKQTEIEFLKTENQKVNEEIEEAKKHIENEEKGLKEYVEIINESGNMCDLLFNKIELAEEISEEMLKFIGIFENAILCKQLPSSAETIPPVNVFFVLPTSITDQQKQDLSNFLHNNAIVCKDESYIDNLFTIFTFYKDRKANLFELSNNLFIKPGQATPKITTLRYTLLNLNEKRNSIIKQVEETSALLQEYANQKKNLQEGITEKRARIYELSVEIQNKMKEYDNLTKEREFINNEIEYLNNSAGLIKNKLANLSTSMENFLRRKQNIEELLATLKNTRSNKLELLKSVEAEFEEFSKKIEEVRISKNTEQSKLENIIQSISECQQKLKETGTELEKIYHLKQESENLNKKYEETIAKFNKEIEENDIIYRRLDEYKNYLAEMEKHQYGEYEALEEEVKKTKKVFGEKKLMYGEISFRVENIGAKITELQNIYIEEFKEEPPRQTSNIDPSLIEIDEEALKNRIRLYEEKLSNFKNINMSAIEKLNMIETELASLENEHTKLFAVMSELSIFLNNLEQQASTIFEETIKSINESFNKYIRKLFEGGRAQVQLSQQPHTKEYEVNLNVQIPNKNVKHIESFSGGERALMSLALLFSFLELKPSPFYVLDEIDASLDDNNLSKLLGLLKEISYNQQIIMISHNKHTLNIADYIIGVTIGEGSYTRIVGIDLEEAVAYATG